MEATSDGTPAAILSIDFAKAYDRLDRNFLNKTMIHYGFNKSFIRLVKLLSEDNTAEIIVNAKITEPIKLERGFRQGCPLALYLYIIYINPFLTRLNLHLKGLNLKNIITKTSAFVDDVVIYTGNKSDLEILSKEIENLECHK